MVDIPGTCEEIMSMKDQSGLVELTPSRVFMESGNLCVKFLSRTSAAGKTKKTVMTIFRTFPEIRICAFKMTF